MQQKARSWAENRGQLSPAYMPSRRGVLMLPRLELVREAAICRLGELGGWQLPRPPFPHQERHRSKTGTFWEWARLEWQVLGGHPQVPPPSPRTERGAWGLGQVVVRASALCAGSGDTEPWLAPGRSLRYNRQQTQCLEWRTETSQGKGQHPPSVLGDRFLPVLSLPTQKSQLQVATCKQRELKITHKGPQAA